MEPGLDPLVETPVPTEDLVTGEDQDVTIDVKIDGEGVEVINDADGKCYIVLPDNSVMSLHQATATEAATALEKLNRSTKE